MQTKTWARRYAVAIVLATWGLLSGGQVHADQLIVVPNSLETVEGNSGLSFLAFSGTREQEVYAASQFAGLGGPHLITQIALRPDIAGGPFTMTTSSIQINLSTTGAVPDALSATFADNIGADTLVVYSGALTLSSAFTGPSGGPKDFDALINLQTPFLYDPSKGNLLVDFLLFGGLPTFVPVFDTQNLIGDSISRVSGEITGTGIPNPDGYVTRFRFAQAIPEPATLVLFGTGALALFGYGWRSKGKGRPASRVCGDFRGVSWVSPRPVRPSIRRTSELGSGIVWTFNTDL